MARFSRADGHIFRFLIAFLQGGFIPDMILYLSYWYKATELPIRLGKTVCRGDFDWRLIQLLQASSTPSTTHH
jgi:hypothetical protein